MNINNCLNKKFPSFDSLNRELSLGFCLIDSFLDYFPFHLVNQKDTNAKIVHCNKLNSIYKDSLINQDIVLIISDISIKNNIATLISHICREQEITTKTVYHAMNVTFTKAELFAIRYSINYATQIQDIAYIIIIMDATLATKCIFDMTIHSYQLYSITISNC